MDIGIVGCGAMGSIYAGLLTSAGNRVIAVDANLDHVRVINARGLRITGASGDRTVELEAFHAAPGRPMDLIVVAVKAAHVAGAAEAVAKLRGKQSLILTIQNGLGSADVLAAELGSDHLIVGVAQGFGASLPEPGHAHHNDMKAIRMGAYANVPARSVARIAEIWRAAGFDAQAVGDIIAMQWEKLICNVAYSAPCALTGMTVGQVMDDPAAGAVSRAAAEEAWRVALARGVNLGVDDPVTHVRDFAARMPDAKPSVLLDIEAGRISEVDVINGAVPREAAKAGLAAPVNATLTGLVQALERRGSNLDRSGNQIISGIKEPPNG